MTLVADMAFVIVAGQRKSLWLKGFEAYGHALLFSVYGFVEAKAIAVAGAWDPKKTAEAISTNCALCRS